MTRAERIAAALSAGQTAGRIGGWYCQSAMPGRRWVVWGTAVGAHEYASQGIGTAPPLAAERAYSTREVEAMLSATGLLAVVA